MLMGKFYASVNSLAVGFSKDSQNSASYSCQTLFNLFESVYSPNFFYFFPFKCNLLLYLFHV